MAMTTITRRLDRHHLECEHPLQVKYLCPTCGQAFLTSLITRTPTSPEIQLALEFHTQIHAKPSDSIWR